MRIRASFATFITFSCLMTLAAHSNDARAADPVAKCESLKVKAAGTYLKAVLTCSSKAATLVSTPDPVCLLKAADKLTSSFNKAGPICAGVWYELKVGLDGDAADIVDEIMPLGYGAAAGKCEAQKLKAAGSYASGRHKAEAGNITKPDAVKLGAKLAKEASKLSTKVVKADGLGGCETVANDAAIKSLADSAADGSLACIPGAEPCDGLDFDGVTSANTDDELDGATAADPVETLVMLPAPGSIAIFEGPITQAPPGSFTFFGQQIDITATDATPAVPLAIVFTLDDSIVAVPAAQVQIFKAGVFVPDCSGAPGTASPDPCVLGRGDIGGGDVQILVLTSTASPWNPGISAGCPDTMTLETVADDGVSTTVSRHDNGSTGFFHDQFPLDEAKLRLNLDCGLATGPCGICSVTGMTPSNMCRCTNDVRTICDQPFAVDGDDCGGAVCQCYSSPPEPFAGGGTPACAVRRLASDPSGTWNPDSGAGDISLDERFDVYLGIAQDQPCPVCVGDATPGDGVRTGTCSGGQHNGQTCDAEASDASYPAPGGGDYSLDCMPSNLALITGVGIDREATHTTGSAPSISSGLSCLFGTDLCHCGTCSLDASVGCASTADCTLVGAGTCASSPANTPNSCASGNCLAVGGGEGECDVDFDTYCDGKVRVDGSGIVTCGNNSDCLSYGAGWGDCLLAQQRKCFLDTVTAAGTPHVTNPVTAATQCVGASVSSAVNNAVGLPGPVRLTTQHAVTYDDDICPTALLWETSADDGVTSTQSSSEFGSTGFFHRIFPLDEMQLQLDLTCGATSAPCGVCTVDGVMPEPGTCRCASDNRTVCDAPLVADVDDCGGGTCNCYTSAPTPFSGGGTPACTVERLATDVTGTWDPGAGSGEILLDERLSIYTGISQQMPCPVCVGDPTPYDGVRGGTCSGGQNNGLSCDAHGSDASFPAPGGGDYSLDCFPSSFSLITGAGLPLPTELTTGATASVSASLTCLFGTDTCHCGTCSLDATVGCASTADCTAVGAGTCAASAGQSPNNCSSGICLDLGGGQGECDITFDTYCDGNVRIDGSGIATCGNNSDCAFLGAGWGDCLLSQARECFLDTITATGAADPAAPTTAALTCLGLSASGAANSALGLPGPVRLIADRTLLTPY